MSHSHFEKKVRQGFKLPLSDHEVTVVSGFATFGWWSGVASGIWEMTTFRAFNQELRPDMVYVGFGEWAGVTGLFAAQRVRKVILMDSDPMAYAELRFNMKLNRPTVKALMETDPRCISSEKGTVRPNPASFRQGVRGDGDRPGKGRGASHFQGFDATTCGGPHALQPCGLPDWSKGHWNHSEFD